MLCASPVCARVVRCVVLLVRVEEEALKEATGVHRVTKVSDKAMDTNARVLAHSARVVRGAKSSAALSPRTHACLPMYSI